MNCNNCGAGNLTGRFCTMCGGSLQNNQSSQMAELNKTAETTPDFDAIAPFTLWQKIGIGVGLFFAVNLLAEYIPHINPKPLRFVIEWGAAGCIFVGIPYYWYKSNTKRKAVLESLTPAQKNDYDVWVVDKAIEKVDKAIAKTENRKDRHEIGIENSYIDSATRSEYGNFLGAKSHAQIQGARARQYQAKGAANRQIRDLKRKRAQLVQQRNQLSKNRPY